MSAAHALPTSALESLTALLGKKAVRTDDDALASWGRDWTKAWPPAPSAVVFPASTAQVQELVRWARSTGTALVPSGGRTGLSGGAVAAAGEVVVSFDRMQTILDWNPTDRLLTCEAGVVTASIHDYAAEQGAYYPVDFASSGSSQIGGNVATNAGGIRVLRYGNTREQVAGLTVVDGRGEVMHLNQGLVKNNTGYDLRHLFTGAEGTLGLITEVQLRLTRQPPEQAVLVLGVPAFAGVLEVLAAFQQRVTLSAFEFFSEEALQHVVARHGHSRPFVDASAYYALVELDEAAAPVALEVFDHCLEQGWVVDGVMSQSRREARDLWRLREDVSESISHRTPYKNDIAVRVSRMPAFIDQVQALISGAYPDFEIIWFGHIGDGNLHLNILKPDDLAQDVFFQRCNSVSKEVFRVVQQHQGSVSAEHGVGLLKRDYLGYSRSDAELSAMRALKQVFDPDGIMNPGKVLR